MNVYKLSQSGNPDQYTNNVDVRVSDGGLFPNYDIEASVKNVAISFIIDVEARSWGIKGISVIVGGQVKVPIIINNPETGEMIEERELLVDLNKIGKEERKGSGVITVGDLDLFLDAQMNIDYKASTLEIFR